MKKIELTKSEVNQITAALMLYKIEFNAHRMPLVESLIEKFLSIEFE